MMKRGLALLLTAGLLAGLTGCAASGEDALCTARRRSV